MKKKYVTKWGGNILIFPQVSAGIFGGDFGGFQRISVGLRRRPNSKGHSGLRQGRDIAIYLFFYIYIYINCGVELKDYVREYCGSVVHHVCLRVSEKCKSEPVIIFYIYIFFVVAWFCVKEFRNCNLLVVQTKLKFFLIFFSGRRVIKRKNGEIN